jgi:serine/threonine protein kinase
MSEKAILIANKFKLLKKIGEGSFGKTFIASYRTRIKRPPQHDTILNDMDGSLSDNDTYDNGNDTYSNDTYDNAYENGQEERSGEIDVTIAIKIMAKKHMNLLENEVSVYEKIKGIKHIPSLYDYGSDDRFNYIAMELLGKSLEDIRKNNEEQLPMKVIIHFGLQMLKIVKDIHDRGIVHCDLKPSNFLIKNNKDNLTEVYLIDYGLAKCFIDDKQRHYGLKTNETIIGTHRYMSVNTHQGFSQSRRDDLESLGYILMFLYHGKLPWQHQTSVSAVIKQKQEFGWCNETIGEFVLFINYCKNLSFTDKPNYIYLQTILTNLSSLY